MLRNFQDFTVVLVSSCTN